MILSLALEEMLVDAELRNINFFNGRLLSAEDLKSEQDVHRARARHLGQAIGAGVACGLEVSRAQNSPLSDVQVEIKAGLAVNKNGHVLRLACDKTISLVRPPDAAKRADCVFSDCAPFGAGSALSGEGYYLLAIAPASQREGLAPVSGLGNSPAACNSRYFTEGVRFRLVQLNVDPGSNANLRRNVVAYQCFGLPPLGPSDFVRAALAPDSAPNYGIEALVQAGQLTEYDVPLAVIEWKANTGLGVVDLWPARRRITRFGAGRVFGHFTDDRRRSEAEAALLQFQDHAAAILREAGVAPNLKAETRFRFLPPAGFLKTGGTDFVWKNFLGAHAPQNQTPLNEGLVRSVVCHSLGQEPVRVIAAADAVATPPVPFHVYRVPSRPDYVLFARSSLGEVLAEDVLFDNSHCKLPGVETVQDAIEALCDACRGCCTLVVHPEPGWEKIFDRIAPGQDAEICFQAGTFSLSKPLVIQGKGHLRIVGCGRATRIICSGGETALHFQTCASVSVGHLRAESGAITRGKLEGPHLSGALNFVNCPVVEVEHVTACCPAGTTRMAACLAVRNGPGAPGQARVHGCELEVGHEQAGILLINTARAQVEDNVLRVGAALSWLRLVGNTAYRAKLVRHLISHVGTTVAEVSPRLPPAAGPVGPQNATVEVAGHRLAFRTPPALATAWQPAVAAFANVKSSHGLAAALHEVAKQALLKDGNIPGLSPAALTGLFGTLVERTAPAGSQGIVVAGQVATDVRVLYNTLTDFVQGVHVGLSHADAKRAGPEDRAGTVLIVGNTIRVHLTAGATRGRHGIFVGSCESLVISQNHLTLKRAPAAKTMPVEGLRVFGFFGRRLIIRENHVVPAGGSTAFNTGIFFRALNVPANGEKRQWIISDNAFESSPTRYEIPLALRQFLRGLDTNIA